MDDAPSLAPTNAELLEQLGVVVRGEHDAVGPPPGNRGDDVDHPHAAERRLGVEGLLARLDARGLQLREDVAAAVGERLRTGRPRAEGHLPPQVLARAVAVELVRTPGSGRLAVRLADRRQATGLRHRATVPEENPHDASVRLLILET